MAKMISIIIIFCALTSCQSKQEKLIGHWHEFKSNVPDYLHCYHITDTTFGIDPLTVGANFYYRRGLDLKQSEIISIANNKYNYSSDFKINGKKLVLNDSIFWIKQTDKKESFLSDFSAGIPLNIHPFETQNSEFDFIPDEKTYGSYIFVGKLKSSVLKKYGNFNKDQYYIGLNDKIAQVKDIIPFLACEDCHNIEQYVFLNVDRNTPKQLLNDIETEISKLNISKRQIYYLTINPTELTSGYNHSY